MKLDEWNPAKLCGVSPLCVALKEKLCDKASNFGKEYLKLLVGEIRVDKKKCTCQGAIQLWQVHFVC
jgi:hypothetical protein